MPQDFQSGASHSVFNIIRHKSHIIKRVRAFKGQGRFKDISFIVYPSACKWRSMFWLKMPDKLRRVIAYASPHVLVLQIVITVFVTWYIYRSCCKYATYKVSIAFFLHLFRDFEHHVQSEMWREKRAGSIPESVYPGNTRAYLGPLQLISMMNRSKASASKLGQV